MKLDFSELPFEVWCDLEEETGVDTESLRELLRCHALNADRFAFPFGCGFPYGYGYGVGDEWGNNSLYSCDTYRDMFSEVPYWNDSLGDGI